MNKKLKAREIMVKPLVFINTEDSMKRAAATMIEHRISGVPVLDLLERPVGVLTKTDLTRYERERSVSMPERLTQARVLTSGEIVENARGFQEDGEEALVSHWMMPNVYSIDEDASLEEVVDKMIRKHVHRLFVNETASTNLVGVITTFDILRVFGEKLKKSKKE